MSLYFKWVGERHSVTEPFQEIIVLTLTDTVEDHHAQRHWQDRLSAFHSPATLTGHVPENKAISLCFKRRKNPRLAVVITNSCLNI